MLGQTDVLIHDRETVKHEKVENTTVRDLMTPAVFAVGRHTPVPR